MRYLILGILLALAGCAPRPEEPRADLRLLGVGVQGSNISGMSMYGVETARLTNTGKVVLYHVAVKALLVHESTEATVLGRFNGGMTELSSLSPNEEAQLIIPYPPEGIFLPHIQNVSVEAQSEDGHPVPIRFTMERAPTQ